MLVANFSSRIPTMGETKTYEDWSKYLGVKPHSLGVMARMYTDQSLSFITDGLRNTYFRDESKSDKFQQINSMVVNWDIETSEIKHIEFADVPAETGENGTEITMAFTEKYYQKYDIFVIEETGQQCIAVSNPIRKNDAYWQIQVRLIDNNYDTILDASGCQVGMTTKFQSVGMPELSEEGYSKFQSQTETHRNYMQTFRVDNSWSAIYAIQEQVFMTISNDKKQDYQPQVYKMMKKEKELMDTFHYVVNSGMLLNKGNVDINGKATISDPHTGRPIYITEGLIPQYEAYSNKFSYNNGNVSKRLLDLVLSNLSDKAQEDTGNHYIFLVNRVFFQQVNTTLGDFLASAKTDGTYLYSMKANKGQGGYVKVGATYSSYEFAGNTITFITDKALSREYPNKGFCLCLDGTEDKTDGKPAVAKFSLLNGGFITSKVNGVGGQDGRTSGEAANYVAGSGLVMMGYGCSVAFNPYRACIIRES